MDKKPNFLLVGAQKAGTTSLYNYLNKHPQIFMSPIKEPLYFTSEIVKTKKNDKRMKRIIRRNGDKFFIDNYNDYLNLFKDVTNEIAIGEASASYLYYYRTSIPKIKEKLGNVKILIILRNPLEKAFSQYEMQKKGSVEPYTFLKAIQKEPERINKNYSNLYHYVAQGLYYEQVKAFFDNFSHVKVLLLDDLKKDPGETMKSIFEFLSVNTSYIMKNYSIYFKTDYIPKSKKLHDFIVRNTLISKCRYMIKKQLPAFYRNSGTIYKILNSFQPILTLKAKNVLYDKFYDDIVKLEDFLGIDLNSWKDSFK